MTNAFITEEHPRISDGTFTDKPQSQPEVGLSRAAEFVEYLDYNTDTARDYAEQVRHDNPRIAREGVAALLAEVHRTVRQMRRRTGLSDEDVQDAVGLTIASLNTAIRNGKSVEGGLINTAASAVCSRFVNGPMRHEDARGIRILKDRIAEEQNRVGHNLTVDEIEDIAKAVRVGAEFDPRHRPKVNFHLEQDFVRPTSFSQFPDSYIDEQMQAYGYGTGSSFEGMGTASDRLVEEFEHRSETGMTKAKARLAAWNAVAEDSEAPASKPDLLTRRDAKNVKRYMSEVPGGVLKAVRDHEEGLQNRNTMALFAPFGDIRGPGRDRIADLLRSRAAHADELWQSALASSTKSIESERAARASV